MSPKKYTIGIIGLSQTLENDSKSKNSVRNFIQDLQVKECRVVTGETKEEEKSLPSLERMLWQIRQNGIFDKINGLVFGLLEPEVQEEETEFQNIQNILEAVTQNYAFPVLYNAQFGHIYPSWVLQNGRKIQIIKDQILIEKYGTKSISV